MWPSLFAQDNAGHSVQARNARAATIRETARGESRAKAPNDDHALLIDKKDKPRRLDVYLRYQPVKTLKSYVGSKDKTLHHLNIERASVDCENV
jgi:hypothetical protein